MLLMLFKIIVAHIFTRRVQRQVDLAVTFRLNGFLPVLPAAVDTSKIKQIQFLYMLSRGRCHGNHANEFRLLS